MSKDRSIFQLLFSIIKSMRTWQWPKNLIVFTIPLGTASTDVLLYQTIFYSFLGISFLASSVYFFNDIIDVESDKTHPTKKKRPIASGEISIKLAYLISILLALIGGGTLAYLSTQSFALGLLYLFINIAYTFKLKYIKIVDVVSISIMFVIRVLISSYSVETPASYFLLGFIFFASTGLAISKRVSVLNDQKINVNTYYKNHLSELYNSKELITALNVTLSLSVITFLFWISSLRGASMLSGDSLFFFFAAILMISIIRKIIALSKIGLLEDFVVGVINEKKLLAQILVALILLILGLYG